MMKGVKLITAIVVGLVFVLATSTILVMVSVRSAERSAETSTERSAESNALCYMFLQSNHLPSLISYKSLIKHIFYMFCY